MFGKEKIPWSAFMANFSCYKEGDAAKKADEVVHNVLFASWLEHNPIT
jgi:hypothetical protein